MAKDVKIICTVVPNPYKTIFGADGKPTRYCFSVVLSPRLANSGKVGNYLEILRWYDFMDVFRSNGFLKIKIAPLSFNAAAKKYSINEAKLTVNSHSVKFDAEELIRLESKLLDDVSKNDIYKKLFPFDTDVSGWILYEGKPSDKITQIVSLADMQKLQRKAQSEAVLEEVAPGILVEKAVDAQAKAKPVVGALDADTLAAETTVSKRIVDFHKDVSSIDLTIDEIKIANKKNQEFHKKLSILSSYPHLLRLTGWIHDFYIDSSESVFFSNISQMTTDPDPAFKNRGVIKFDFSGLGKFISNRLPSEQKWQSFMNEVDFITPWTYFNPIDFTIKYAEVLEGNYFSVQKGYIKKSPAVQLEASQFNMSSFVESRLAALNEGAGSIGDNNQAKQKEKVMEQTSGLSVFVPKSKLMETTINTNPDDFNLQYAGGPTAKLGDVNINDYIFFGHHLDTGYRIDVARMNANGPEKFHSLCNRIADYTVDKSTQTDVKKNELILKSFEDEPWIAESAQGGKSGALYTDEELFRWNNWSLTCPHVGNYKGENEEEKEGQYEFNDIELEKIYPYRLNERNERVATLLPLRFGIRYAFRLRVVDLCGNSPSLDQTNNLTDPTYNVTTKEAYKRFEGIEPVELFFENNIYRNKIVKNTYKEQQPDGSFKEHQYKEVVRELKPAYAGEDIKTMVIRTYVSRKGHNTRWPTPCLRYVCAPRVTPQFAELHGVFDYKVEDKEAGKKQQKLYTFLKNMPAGLEEVSNKNEIVPFITDPLVAGIRVMKEQGVFVTTPDNKPVVPWEEKDYLSHLFARIMLIRTKFKGWLFSVSSVAHDRKPAANTVMVHVKWGTITEIAVHPLIYKERAAILAESAKTKGDLKIRCVHAVQRPVFLNFLSDEDDKLNKVGIKPVDRTPEQPINIEFTAIDNSILPLGTSEELIILAYHNEYVRDPENKSGNGYKFAKKRTITRKVYSNISEKNDNNLSGLQCTAEAFVGYSKYFNNLSHDFGDTKYREVAYQIECVSRFREFFRKPKNNSSYFSRFFDVHYTKEGTLVTKHKILNSQRPRPLEIDRILPVFSWVDDRKNGEGMVTRKSDLFRIYFTDKEWFTTGEGEKVACFSQKANFELSNTQKLDYVSEIGKDPSVKGDPKIVGINYTKLKGGRIKSTVIHSDNEFWAERVNVDLRLLPTEGDDMFGNSFFKNIDVDTFDIQFDGKEFFVEIKFDLENYSNYFPFLKLVLARYQEHSIYNVNYKNKNLNLLDKLSYDFRFSALIAAPTVQLMPERRVQFTKTSLMLDVLGRDKTDYNNRKNEVWLIAGRASAGGLADLSENDDHQFIKFLGDNAINHDDYKGYQAVYLEEYEYYEVDGAFTQPDFERSLDCKVDYTKPLPNYNPRNDIRKRLVFTYRIK